MVRRASAAALASRAALRDVGNFVVGEGDDRVSRPVGRLRGRASLCGVGRPAPQVLEDAPHHARIVDQGDQSHRPAFYTSARRALQGIGFVHLADEPRPGGPGAGGELAHVFDASLASQRIVINNQGLHADFERSATALSTPLGSVNK